ncbi:MAG: hypothetical protein JXR48_07290 [Candidatus Delongbacteria bacterium]|nr:hypothetical protein [Candidatus Delongbacteria bacterium]MBN2834755.1 hypothetical protein [Candidatus Delongbacteria bacterium]
MNSKFESFRFFINKTWKGELHEGGADKLNIDISKWELILNGMAIKNTHSLNDGEYGGETIIYHNRQTDKLEFYYFTTAGFMTTGNIINQGDNFFEFYEEVTGNKNGITAVKSRTELIDENTFKTSSQYLQNGNWIEGHGALYKRLE